MSLARSYRLYFLASLFIGAGSLLSVTAWQKGTQEYPPIGKLVMVGGRRLHINCAGKGGPTVVVENGTGDFSFDWSLVQPEVAKFTRICTYDRAGYAWSDPGPKPRTFGQIALELHTGLLKLGVKGPYVMVGQSYGGFPARAFAKAYINELAGMVLVDVLHEDSRIIIGGKAIRLREEARGRTIPSPQIGQIQSGSDTKSISRPEPKKSAVEPPLDRLPPGIQQIRLWAETQPDYLDAGENEREWSVEELARMYANRESLGYPLGDRPLIVLTRARGGYRDGRDILAEELEKERLRLHSELARLSRNSQHIIAKNSGHNIHLEAPDLVIEAIRHVVDAARRKSKLAAIESR